MYKNIAIIPKKIRKYLFFNFFFQRQREKTERIRRNEKKIRRVIA